MTINGAARAEVRWLGRRRPGMVPALVALSGFSFDVDQPGDAQLALDAAGGRGMPTFYGRDPAGPAIPALASAWALRYLRTHTAVREHSYPGLGHSLSMPGITDVIGFLEPFWNHSYGASHTGTPPPADRAGDERRRV